MISSLLTFEIIFYVQKITISKSFKICMNTMNTRKWTNKRHLAVQYVSSKGLNDIYGAGGGASLLSDLVLP